MRSFGESGRLFRDDTWKKQYAPYFLSLHDSSPSSPGFLARFLSMARRTIPWTLGPWDRARPQCLSTSVSEIFPLERASAIDVTPGSLLLSFFFSPSCPDLLPLTTLLFLQPKTLSFFLSLCPFLARYNRAGGDLFSHQLPVPECFRCEENTPMSPPLLLFIPSSPRLTFLPFPPSPCALVPLYMCIYIYIHPPASSLLGWLPPLGFLRHAL